MAEYSAALYAKTPEEKANYLIYYRDYYQKQSKEASTGYNPQIFIISFSLWNDVMWYLVQGETLTAGPKMTSIAGKSTVNSLKLNCSYVVNHWWHCGIEWFNWTGVWCICNLMWYLLQVSSSSSTAEASDTNLPNRSNPDPFSLIVIIRVMSV